MRPVKLAVWLAVGLSGLAMAATSAVEVGRVESGSGAVTLLVLEIGGKKVGGMYVRDRTGVRTTLISMDRARLVELRDLIDKTIAELDR